MNGIDHDSLQLAEDLLKMRDDKQQWSGRIKTYLIAAESKPGFDMQLFSHDQKWLNTKPLEPDDIAGKIALLDFFTYCCINCIHMFPFLNQMESLFSVERGLVVIGVHSAKFPNEKDSKNISHALQKYDITHPVLNDSNLELWEKLCIKCWPTFVLISPQGKVLLSLPGETHTDVVEAVITEAMVFYHDKISPHSLQLSSSCDVTDGIEDISITKQSYQLHFPSKIAINQLDNLLAISDTGNHRILVCSLDGNVVDVIGGMDSGMRDGDFQSARFNSPQGIAWHGKNSIYVADCDNHLIKKIDLLVRRVVTIAGDGNLGNDLEGGRCGTEQPLCSPWDLQVAGSPRFPGNKSILYIAMSGIHQIWAFFLQDADWQKGSEYKMGTCLRFAGNGQEENRNNSYPHKAGFAQPSGLSVDYDTQRLFVADSESSTIRKVNLSNGAVEALVGGHFDPTNLFAFGDEDGKGRNAKLQHPLCVSWDKRRSQLYVADSYNHKIKRIDPVKKTCLTLIGPEQTSVEEWNSLCYPSMFPPAVLNEPGGICVDSTCENLYIADTNNHQIKVLNLCTGDLKALILNLYENKNETEVDAAIKRHRTVNSIVQKSNASLLHVKPVSISANQILQLKISVKGINLTDDAPSAWQLVAGKNGTTPQQSGGDANADLMLIDAGTFQGHLAVVECTIPASDILSAVLTDHPKVAMFENEQDASHICLRWESTLYYCLENSHLCTMKSFVCTLPITVHPPTDEKNLELLSVPICFAL